MENQTLYELTLCHKYQVWRLDASYLFIFISYFFCGVFLDWIEAGVAHRPV